ncbi:hypothetical protein [Mucilaginibacter flavus]|uniref:hypothetical protein n=1 Tax=Mucilaginibacter flavus TaxID=931504 RepID=UPI0025B4A48E|nr:hypothetical protein [Mucilaginibacter flavus]MDN3584738.1 hypothetical protein [Mucilaginibacter flavus]
MIKKTRKPKNNKLRALQTKYNKLKQKSMAFFKRGRFGRKSYGGGYNKPRYNKPRFNNRRSYRGGGSRIPIVGRLIPRALQPFILLAAIVGGVWYFFKDQLKPMIEKLKNHTA